MNKTAIKNFSIWARNKLITDISYRAGLMGITDNGIADPLPQSTDTTEFYDIGTADPYTISGVEIKQRKDLIDAIHRKEADSDYETAYKYIIEEVAYTWFNRLIAVRFMEVNDYLPSHIRILSSESGKMEPDLVTTPFDADLEFTAEEEVEINQLKLENDLDDVFRILFIRQCNALNEILPDLFEKTGDYTEVLLNLSVIDQDGIVYHLVNDIIEKDWKDQVQIIGWLYQYYISEKHEEIVDPLHGKSIKKEDIPAATQLFTTDWVVHYMVDNSLGRYWVERKPESKLISRLNFFVTPKDGHLQYIDEKISPKNLTVFDPCMGSGHILVYAFDVLIEIYKECGYSVKDAVSSILQNNLFGLDIDDRCSQLAYFSLMMKARSYDHRFFSRHIEPHVMSIQESNGLNNFINIKFMPDSCMNEIAKYLVDVFLDSKEIGSLKIVEHKNYEGFKQYLLNCTNNAQIDIEFSSWQASVLPLLKHLTEQAIVLSREYTVVCTNPPYMNKLEGQLREYVRLNYKAYSGDLFSAFIYRNFYFCEVNGYSAFMTPNVWMFLKNYEKLRAFILQNKCIATLVQLAKGAFFKEATVDVCTFVLKNTAKPIKGLYFRLEEFKGGMDVQREKVLEAIKTPNCDYRYEIRQDDFFKIPGFPISYWVSKDVRNAFVSFPSINDILETRNGMSTTNNNLFLKLWFELEIKKCGLQSYTAETAQQSGKKWFRYNKGGEFRRWYGNNEYVVNWGNNGQALKKYVSERYGSYSKEIRSEDRYFFESITWSGVTSSTTGFRFSPQGAIFDSGANGLFAEDTEVLEYTLGFLNSKLTIEFIKCKNPTINTGSGTIGELPLYIKKEMFPKVIPIVKECIKISQSDWDSFETSWDFKRHPLVSLNSQISSAYTLWKEECCKRFNQLKTNEEELNHIFIDLYGLQGELAPEVEDEDITVRRADLQRDIRSFLSYAVGCMFGRYSLDIDGLVYAGGDWDDSKYTSFKPDADDIIPITGEEYLEDDIVSCLCQWLKIVYGEETLEENLDFIAQALGNKGDSSRDVIRNYFLKEFFTDHCKIYQKRPIYWLFDSGKQNGFKALVYLHRYTPDTIGDLRIDYLHRMQRIYDGEINRMQDTIDHSDNSREVTKATKRKEKLQKQLKECQEYDEKISHLALSRIELDLDDGVKVNYEKVQIAQDGKKYQVLAKI